MPDAVIKVRSLGKRYEIGELQNKDTKSILDIAKDVYRGSRRTLRSLYNPGSFRNGDSHIWALRNVSFEVERGETLGIIGHNGAGKSTLLKILTRITDPTEGEIRLKGRVGALLEVGSGFSGMLSGRENIYLNGAILGMTKGEIDRKFDEIVNFAGVEQFIDTPVRHYSTGMYLRLAFAVAAHLESEILLGDEVLAVGDAAFQQKCLGKMSSVAGEGRTVLFVSHNMAAMEHLCSRAILLNQGQIIAEGEPSAVIVQYFSRLSGELGENHSYSINRELIAAQKDSDFRITDLELLDASGKSLVMHRTGEPLTLRIQYEAHAPITAPAFAVFVKTMFGQEVIRLSTMPISGYRIEQLGERGIVDLHIDSLPLTGGRYYVDVGLAHEKSGWVVRLDQVITLDIVAKDVYGSGMALDQKRGLFVVQHQWDHRPIGTGVGKR